MISDPKLPEYNNKSDAEKAVKEARNAIEEALGYIQRQEDGPFTMTVALREIDSRLEVIETELCIGSGTIDKLNDIAMRLKTERDEAIYQRDLIMMVSGITIRTEE